MVQRGRHLVRKKQLTCSDVDVGIKGVDFALLITTKHELRDDFLRLLDDLLDDFFDDLLALDLDAAGPL